MRRSIAPILVLILSTAARSGELPRGTPGEVGLSAGKLAGLKPALQKLVDDGKTAGGVVLIQRHGKEVYLDTFGFRDLATREPMTEDTIFAIASMTKPITCVAVMRLVEQGKLGLEDPVGKYIPELREMRVLGDPKDDDDASVSTVPAARPITIRHLLSHTSGLAYGGLLATNPRLRRAYDKAGVELRGATTLAEEMTKLAKVPLAHQPGEGWTYGLSHDVLGRVVEVVTGRSFDRHLRETIFGPLDMKDTFFHVPDSKRDRVATIYQANILSGKLTPLPKGYGSETYFSGGGGLFSTARDYGRFVQMLLDGGEFDGARIIDRKSLQQMTRNEIGPRTAFGLFKYGLGFGLEMQRRPGAAEPEMSRYFWGGLFSTNFWVDPHHDLGAVILTQVLPTNHGGALLILRERVDAALED